MKEGWTKKRMDEVCSIARGGSPRPIKDYITNDSNGLNWIKIGDTDMGGKYIYSTKEKIKPEGLKKSRWVEEDEFLLSNSMSFGRPYILKTNGCIHDGWLVLRDYQKYLNIEFFYYVLSSEYVQRQFRTKAQGSTVSNLNTDRVASVTIPVPPLSEQQSIVDYLDSAFAKIDAMKANAEKALNEAKALFQASLKEMLEPKEGWEEKKIGDICEIIRGKRFVRTDIVEDGVPCIHYGDIYTHYGLSVKKTRGCISPELAKKMRFAEKNDVVVVQAGENNWDIGVGIAYFGDEPAAVHDACFILKHKQNPMYITYYLRSYNYHWYLLDYVHEGKICSFLKPALENAPIPLPPLSEQQSIVETLDSLKSKVDRLQENFDKISQECDALKQAILRQVFE